MRGLHRPPFDGGSYPGQAPVTSFEKQLNLLNCVWRGGIICALPVRKLIRSTATRAFLAKEGGWTTDISKARQIASFWEATETMQSLKLRGAEFYFAFDDAAADDPDNFSVPLD